MAKFEVDFSEALRQLAAFMTQCKSMGAALDKLQADAGKPLDASGKLIRDMHKYYSDLEAKLTAITKDTETVGHGLLQARRTAQALFSGMAADNLKLTVAAQAYNGELKELERLLKDSAAKSSFVRWAKKTASLEHELANETKHLQERTKSLDTEQAQLNATTKVRLQNAIAALTADEKNQGQIQALGRAFEFLATAEGQALIKDKARLQNLTASLTADEKNQGQIQALGRAFEFLATAEGQALVKDKARLQNLTASLTADEKNQGQIQALGRAFEFLATAEGQALIKDKARLQNLTASLTADEKNQGQIQALGRAFEFLATAEGQALIKDKARLQNLTASLTADEKNQGQIQALGRAFEFLATAEGQAFAKGKARLQNLTSAAQEQVKYEGQVEATKRSIEALSKGEITHLHTLRAVEHGYIQAATAAQREANQLAELERKEQSLTNGTARQILIQKEKNRQIEAAIRQSVRVVEETERLTKATANQRAADERAASTLKAKESAMMEAARAAHQMTEAEAKALAKAEALAAATKRNRDRLLDQARAAHGMSKAQVELAKAHEKESQKLQRLQQQVSLLSGGYGRQLAALQAQIAKQERYNQLLAMSTAELLGFSNAQRRANAALNVGSQSAAMLRAGLAGLQSSIGMYTSATIVAAAATYAFTRSLRESVTIGAEFTATMARADAIMSKGGQEWMTSNLGAMEAQVRALGQTTVYTASEVAAGLVELGQAGVSSADAITALKPALTLAQVGNISMAESADIATNVMMTFGYEAKDLTMIVDEMSFAVANSNTTISQLANALSYAGPAAEAAGISMRETIVAVEALSNNGIKASRAGTALRRLFVSLLNPTEKGSKVLEKYGISAKNLDGSTRPLVEVLEQLQASLSKVDEGERLTAIQNLVGVYATSSIAALVNSTDKFKTALRDHELLVEGAAERMRAKMEQGLKFDWKQTISAFEEVQLQVFDRFESHLRNYSTTASKYLVDLTLPKVVWDETGNSLTPINVNAQAHLDDTLSAEVLARSSSGMGDLAAATYQVEEAVKALGLSYDNAFQIAEDGRLTVATGLDLLVHDFLHYGKIVGQVAAGFLAFKVIGGAGGVFAALASDAKAAGDRLHALQARAAGASFATVTLGNSFSSLSARMAASGLSMTSLQMKAGLLAGSFNLKTAALNAATAAASRLNPMNLTLAGTLSMVTGAAGLATKALHGLAIAGSAVMRALGWVGLLWGLYEAVKTLWGEDSVDAARRHSEEVERAKESYERLKTAVEAYGLAKERAAVREEIKTSEQQIKDAEEQKAKAQALAQELTKVPGLMKAMKDAGIDANNSISAEVQYLTDHQNSLQASIERAKEGLSSQASAGADLIDSHEQVRQALGHLIVAQGAEAEALKETQRLYAGWNAEEALEGANRAYDKAKEKTRELTEEVMKLLGAASRTAERLETLPQKLARMRTEQKATYDKHLADEFDSPAQAMDRAEAEQRRFDALAKAAGMTAEQRAAALSRVDEEVARLGSSGNMLLAGTKQRLAVLEEERRALRLSVIGGDTLDAAHKRAVKSQGDLVKAGKSFADQVVAGNEAEQERQQLLRPTIDKLKQLKEQIAAAEAAELGWEAQRAAGTITDNRFYELQAGNRVRLRDLTKELISAEKSRTSEQSKAGKLTDAEKATEKLQEFIEKSTLTAVSARNMAAAYRDGGKSLAALTTQQKVEEELLKLTQDGLVDVASAREKLTAAVTAQKNAEDSLVMAKEAHSIALEVDALRDEAQATLEGADALARYNDEKELAALLADKNTDALKAETAELLKQQALRRQARAEMEAASHIRGLADSAYPVSATLRKDSQAAGQLDALYGPGDSMEKVRAQQLISESRRKAALEGLPEANLQAPESFRTPFTDMLQPQIEKVQGLAQFDQRKEDLTLGWHDKVRSISDEYLAAKEAANLAEYESQAAHNEEMIRLQAERDAKLKSAHREFNADTANLDDQRLQYSEQMGQMALISMMGTAETVLGMFASAGEDATKAQKMAFIAQKALAVAQIILYTEVAASRVGAEAGIFGLTLAETIRAQGYASAGLVGALAVAEYNGAGKSSSGGGSSYAGAYDDGGFIPYNSYGIVGEYGPEIVHGPANVTSRKESAKQLGSRGGEYNITLAPQINVTAGDNKSGSQPSNSDMQGIAAAVKNAVVSSLQEQMRPNGILDTWIRNKRG